MGRLFVVSLEGKIYSCKHCGTHLALCEDIVSKSFHSRHGKAYLFNKVANVTVGETEERMMMTGLHVVADIFCVRCGSLVGWKYETAHEKSQKYKEGKSVLERLRFQALMETITGPVTNRMLQEEATLMMFNELLISSYKSNCTFFGHPNCSY